MTTKRKNIQDYDNYIKCGEILKSPLQNLQDELILKCYLCNNIHFILEAFTVHIQEHYKDVLTLNGVIEPKAAANHYDEVESESVENSTIKFEESEVEVEDPLIVVKNEVCDENSRIIDEVMSDSFEQHEDFEDNFSDTNDELQTEDAETETEEDEDEINCKSSKKSKNKSKLSTTVEKFMKSKGNVKTLIELYKNQPNLWNKNFPFYHFRDKRQQILEEMSKEMNNKLSLALTGNQLSEIISYINRKYGDDFRRLQIYNDQDNDKKYKRCWFYEYLHFLRPKAIIQLQKIDKNQPDLTKQQIIKILEIYKEYPYLWNSNLIEYICTNKRQESQIEMLKSLETNLNLKISKAVLEEYLRTIHNYFKKEKRLKSINANKKVVNKTKTSKENYFESMIFLNDHEGPFNCSECKRFYAKPLGFRVHKSQHDGSIPLKCSHCNKEFKKIGPYTTHAKRHLEDLKYDCKDCDKRFLNLKDLKAHIVTHTGDRPYCCEICGAAYRYLHCFKRHYRRHEKRFSHTCHICSKGYYSKDRYDDHMNSHMNIRSHICKVCGKGFITSRALKVHAVTHEDVRNHACNLCGKTFKLKIGVLQHMRTHGSKVEIEEGRNEN